MPRVTGFYKRIQGMVAIDIDHIQVIAESVAVFVKPLLQFSGVHFLQIAPQNQAVLTFGGDAGHGHNPIYLSAACQSQAEQVVSQPLKTSKQVDLYQ